MKKYQKPVLAEFEDSQLDLTAAQRMELNKEIDRRNEILTNLIIRHVPRAELNALEWGLVAKFLDVCDHEPKVFIATNISYEVHVFERDGPLGIETFRGGK
jgi:hypothetical protein